MKRRILCFLTVFILCVNFGVVNAFAYPDGIITHNGINYRVLSVIGNAGAVEITENPNASGDIVIPASFTRNGVEYTVLDVGNDAFNGCHNLKSCILPDSIEKIGDGAFMQCTDLTSIKIPANVKTIGYNSFTICFKLVSIDVDNKNQKYSSQGGVLFDKSQKILIQYPEGKKDAHYSVPDGITTIDATAFRECIYLASIHLPASVDAIKENIAIHCNNLTSIEVDADNLSFVSKDGVLFNKDMTVLIKYPNGKQGGYTVPGTVKHIQAYAFINVFALNSINLPDGLESIGYSALRSCGFSLITIPANVKTFEDYIFTSSILQSITFYGISPPIFEHFPGYDANTFCNSSSLTRIFVPAGSKEAYTKALSGQMITDDIRLLDQAQIIELGASTQPTATNQNPNTGR